MPLAPSVPLLLVPWPAVPTLPEPPPVRRGWSGLPSAAPTARHVPCEAVISCYTDSHVD